MTHTVFNAPPTGAAFMKSNARIRILAGPVGSGKTVTCVWDLFKRACEQSPAQDGLRYTRFAIVRQTLQQLKMTVLKDILEWLGPVADYKVSDSTIRITAGDVRSEWIMIPLENPEDQKRLLSSQLTGVWMSEAIEMDIGLVGPILGRCGRYPAGARGNCTWHGMVADTNMPSEGSEWHKLMELQRPPTWHVFVQPGGMEPDAENLANLRQTDATRALPEDDPVRQAQGRQYYIDLVNGGHSEDFLKRYVHAQYGDDPSGQAVFRESFKRSFHVVKEIPEPVYGHPLLIGQDFGRDPCSIICQLDHKGRLLVLEEVLAEGIGLELHVERSLRPVLVQPRYMGRAVAVIGDPAGRSKDSISEETSFDALKRLGFSCFPAPTNDPDSRLRAVEAFLGAQRDGGPAMVIDGTRCPKLVRALDGGYRFGKTKSGQRKPKPDKNEYSHIADALQYACLVAHGREYSELVGRHLMINARKPRKLVRPGAWT